MAVLTPTALKGQPFFEGTSAFRNHDDSSDNFVAGVYTHKEIEYSATEHDEVVSWMMYINQLLRGGGVALAIRNESGGTFTKGTILYVSGYSAAQGKFLVLKADPTDAAKPGMLVLAADLGNNANGVGYAFSPVTGLDTSLAGAVGDKAYLSATAGAFTFTAPTSNGADQQVVGIVTTKDAVNGAIQFFPGRGWLERFGSRVFQGTFALSGVISPAALGSNQDNYNPTNLSTAAIIRQDLSASVDITGLAGGAAGRIVWLINIHATNNITLKNEDAASTAANRFALPADLTLSPKCSVILWYDSASSRWRVLQEASVPGDITGVTAGSGLSGGGTSGDVTLDVNVDNSTIEVNADTLRVKDDGIAYAKIQNVSATDKVLGRSTAGAGDVEEIACTAAGRALIDDADADAQRVTLGTDNNGVAKTGAYTLTAAERQKVFTNTGAGAQVELTLPASPSVFQGPYLFAVTNANGIRIKPQGSAKIRINTSLSTDGTGGGYVENNNIGTTLILYYVDTNLWLAISVIGSWTVV